MAFKEDLITARSYIVFIAGLLTAFADGVLHRKTVRLIKTQIPPVAMIKTRDSIRANTASNGRFAR
jgi:hypothetical protein